MKAISSALLINFEKRSFIIRQVRKFLVEPHLNVNGCRNSKKCMFGKTPMKCGIVILNDGLPADICNQVRRMFPEDEDLFTFFEKEVHIDDEVKSADQLTVNLVDV